MRPHNAAFGAAYAKYYDMFYSDKDYEKECSCIEEIFCRFGRSRIKDVLDISCGTGGHAIPLAQRGYNVRAFDSSKYMVARAEQKAGRLGVAITFGVADMRTFSLSGKYDACLSMFDSLDYLPQHGDLETTFLSVAKHLKPDSLFVFQLWNGVAVLMMPPSARCKVVAHGRRRVVRYSKPVLRAFDQTYEVVYHSIATQGHRVVDEFEEQHLVRFFFPLEVRHALARNGFDVLGMYPDLTLDREATEKDWSITVVARLSQEIHDAKGASDRGESISRYPKRPAQLPVIVSQ